MNAHPQLYGYYNARRDATELRITAAKLRNVNPRFSEGYARAADEIDRAIGYGGGLEDQRYWNESVVAE